MSTHDDEDPVDAIKTADSLDGLPADIGARDEPEDPLACPEIRSRDHLSNHRDGKGYQPTAEREAICETCGARITVSGLTDHDGLELGHYRGCPHRDTDRLPAANRTGCRLGGDGE